MDGSQVVATTMFDAAAVSQLMTESGRNGFDFELPQLTGVNPYQNAYLHWYGRNWRQPQSVKIKGGLSNKRAELDSLLPREVLSVTGFDMLADNQLGMVTYYDLSGGFSASTKPDRIFAEGNLYQGVRVDARGAHIYRIPDLEFPLVKMSHSRTLDLWMTVPNQPMTEGCELFQFATGVMDRLKPFLHEVTDKWAYIEVPEVKATVCHEAAWLRGLGVSGRQLGQVFQVCHLGLSNNQHFNFFREPTITSEDVTGPPTLSFDHGFVVWVMHLNNKLVGPVIHVPTSIWQKVG